MLVKHNMLVSNYAHLTFDRAEGLNLILQTYKAIKSAQCCSSGLSGVLSLESGVWSLESGLVSFTSGQVNHVLVGPDFIRLSSRCDEQVNRREIIRGR